MNDLTGGLPARGTAGRPRRSGTPPPRPGALAERLAQLLLLAASPRLARREGLDPPPGLGAPTPVAAAGDWYGRQHGRIEGSLFGPERARGLVVFVPPWVPRGASWFYRGGRIEAAVAAGYRALVLDLPGVRGSGRRGPGLLDRELRAVIEHAHTLAAGAPVHVWAVSFGGYWSQIALSGGAEVEAAIFEDVARHPLLWAHREAPRARIAYRFFERTLPTAYRYLDLIEHAPHLAIDRGLWIGGALDRGALAAETAEIARRARGESLIVPGAGHLAAFKLAGPEILERAMALISAD